MLYWPNFVECPFHESAHLSIQMKNTYSYLFSLRKDFLLHQKQICKVNKYEST